MLCAAAALDISGLVKTGFHGMDNQKGLTDAMSDEGLDDLVAKAYGLARSTGRPEDKDKS